MRWQDRSYATFARQYPAKYTYAISHQPLQAHQSVSAQQVSRQDFTSVRYPDPKVDRVDSQKLH